MLQAHCKLPPFTVLRSAGANDTVTLDLRGVSNAFVQPGQPTTAITGTAGGINVVQVCRLCDYQRLRWR